jgi:hypothetical protein
MRNKGRCLALVAAGAMLFGACGGASGSSSDDVSATTAAKSPSAGVVIHDRLVNAAATTVDAGSARVAMTMTMHIPGTTAVGTVKAEGVEDFTTHDAQLTMDMDSLLSQIAPDQYSGDTSVEVRIVDHALYMKYPESFAPLMGSRTEWLKIDLSGAASQMGLPDGALDQYEQNDPSQYLRYLTGVSSDVQTVGHEAVRGVDTTHYHATIDLAKGMSTVPKGLRNKLGVDAQVLDKMYAQLQKQLGSTTLPIDVWIDSGGRLRRLAMEMSTKAAGVGIDMELYDYGVAVHVEAPPADQVTDLFSMLRGGTSNTGSGSYGSGLPD